MCNLANVGLVYYSFIENWQRESFCSCWNRLTVKLLSPNLVTYLSGFCLIHGSGGQILTAVSSLLSLTDDVLHSFGG
jgi:hypothetical protein